MEIVIRRCPCSLPAGMRVTEFIALRWDMIDLKQGPIHVNRLKNGIACIHPLRRPKLCDLRRLAREYGESSYVFMRERKGPLTAETVRKLLIRPGEAGSCVH